MIAAFQIDLVSANRDAIGIAADIAIVLVGLLVVVALLYGVILLGRVYRLGRDLERTTRELRGSARPILEHGRGIAANVEFISAALRTDVERLNDSVHALSDRLHQASDRMETRIEEFNALMEVVQGEAEEAFLHSAATARGVRATADQILGTDRAGGKAPSGESTPSDPRRRVATEPTPEARPVPEAATADAGERAD